MSGHIVIIGAGIVGVSAGIWLRRFGAAVTIVDRGPPGMGASYGNAGVLASCSMVPVTAPGLVRKGPGYLMNPDFPLFMRWSYLPKLAPWLIRYLGNANDADTRRIAAALTPIVGDSVEQHKALTDGTGAEHWVTDSDYNFAYANRAAFEADAYTWALRREAGFEPELREGPAVQDQEPDLSTDIGCLATVGAHGFIRDPGGYVAALAQTFVEMGGELRQSDVTGFDLSGDQIRAIETTDGPIACETAIIATGVWSKSLMKKLGLDVPLESERGYHIVFEGAENGPRAPTMVASGKFVATPMAAGVRCAGVVEFGGLDAEPSKAPFELLRRQARAAFPDLTFLREEEWMGHRPAPADSLPLIGQIGTSGVYTGFGHHHIGLTGGPKTGRLIAEMLTRRTPNTDMTPYSPNRFANE